LMRGMVSTVVDEVQEWRNGVETDLDDVLQINNVFTNVSKGEVAKHDDLTKAFGEMDTDDIVKEILKKGEVQIGETERNHELAKLWKEIATIISEKCVDPETQKPIPVGMIEKAMTEVGFSVKTTKTAKSQVTECIRLIQTNSKLPIQRAKMRVRVVLPTAPDQSLKETIFQSGDVEEENDGAGEWGATLLIDPSQFRVINDLLQKQAQAKGTGRIETLAMAATSTSTV